MMKNRIHITMSMDEARNILALLDEETFSEVVAELRRLVDRDGYQEPPINLMNDTYLI